MQTYDITHVTASQIFPVIMMPFIVVVGMSQLSIDRLPRQN